MTPTRRRGLAAVIVVTVAADWATKLWVRGELPPEARRTLVDGWLSVQHSVNPGIAFSGLRDLPNPWRLPLLVALAVAAMAAIVAIVRESRDAWVHLAGALILGGAVGNLGDRLLDGGVTDFILVHFFPYVFNVADVAINVGGALLVLRMLADARRRRAPTAAA